ncbi:nucleotidyltransferase family protein [Paenibacillus rhizovicinus]|uniref:Nucleotidyltransferase family protein n=1 Tax=Paenibacillus rhizovicinus TaxID=2704463 RepID=A0A6C0P2F3_9BACL|nr:nucleotidyltransferase family protein [Paenibacillus rhizovicinus]QHW30852.1 nucleotidyltransferase family protein [Paenibacillus rhizovicinus]
MLISSDLDLSPFPNELHFILWLLREEDHAAQDALMIEILLEELDWYLFLALAKHHRVIPTIYAKLCRLDRGLIPDDIHRKLKDDYQFNTFKMLHLCGEMERVCRAFEDHEVRALMLKGPILAEALYGDLSLRTSKDLDILVAFEQLEQAEEVLLSLGYESDMKPVLNNMKRKTHHISYSHPDHRVQVEVHWQMRPNSTTEPSFDALWTRRRVSERASGPVNFLGEDDLLFHLVIHGARHGWFRLRWLTDIDRMVRQGVNWSSALPIMNNYRAYELCSQALILVSKLFHTPITGDAIPFMSDKRGRRLAQTAVYIINSIADASVSATSGDVHKRFRRYMLSIMTPRERWNYAIAYLYPSSQDAEVLPLPVKWHALYFPLRPFLWFWRRIHWNQ